MDRVANRCPVCGAPNYECPDAAPVPMPYPPVDIAEEEDRASGPLRMYLVQTFGTTTTMRLNDTDAARYGDAATLI